MCSTGAYTMLTRHRQLNPKILKACHQKRERQPEANTQLRLMLLDQTVPTGNPLLITADVNRHNPKPPASSKHTTIPCTRLTHAEDPRDRMVVGHTVLCRLWQREVNCIANGIQNSTLEAKPHFGRSCGLPVPEFWFRVGRV